MSFLSSNKMIPNKNEIHKGWHPHQRNLIRIIKKYPVIYHPVPKNPTKGQWVILGAEQYKSVVIMAWKEIALLSNMTSKTCKQLWLKIKFKYAKIMILLNTGILSKEDVMSHPETSKYLDGSLSFLDPYIDTITDEVIPYHIHRSINNMFHLVTLRGQNILSRYNTKFFTHEQVKIALINRIKEQEDDSGDDDMGYLENIVEKAVERKLEDLLKNNAPSMNTSTAMNNILDEDDENTVNVTVIPSNNCQNMDVENTSDQINLGLESELIIEDDIKMENEDENLTVGSKVNNTVENDALEHILPDTQIEHIVHDTMNNTLRGLDNSAMDIADNFNHITTTESNTHAVISDDYIRTFFKELGVVMSMELTMEKQNILKLRINALVKNLLEME